mmetsp:Transcript_26857/g.45780  ORF Transcript_26857/g.45780 Transcript_26857/m.45780 type:complete len:190 (-) Transcript_26857:176-745(-)
MEISISNVYRPKPKRESKKVHRRATIDTPYHSRPKQVIQRRPSLPLKKSVQFSMRSEVCVFESSPTKKWYTTQDHARFKRERISDVVSFRERSRSREQGADRQSANPATGAGSCCPVGLEQLLSTRGMLQAHSNRKVVIQSVLIEQSRQRSYGIRDPDQIALLSVKLSEEAFEGAQKRGKFQEMAKFVE